MWAADAGLNFASANISAAYLHTREFNVSYNLFDPPDGKPITESGWHTGSPYYAALLLAETMSSNGSVVVDLNIEASVTPPSSTIAGYGIYDNGGTTRGKLVLFNYDNGQTQTFAIPANTTIAAGVRLLLAPDVAERNNISWAGQTIGLNGVRGIRDTIIVSYTNFIAHSRILKASRQHSTYIVAMDALLTYQDRE